MRRRLGELLGALREKLRRRRSRRRPEDERPDLERPDLERYDENPLPAKGALLAALSGLIPRRRRREPEPEGG